MSGQLPRFLYKYRRFNAYSLASLANNSLWFSKPREFNDPFDCALGSHYLSELEYQTCAAQLIRLNIGFESARLGEQGRKFFVAAEESFKKINEQIREQSESVDKAVNELESVGICSFSEIPDQLLMWAHYADNHRGFCVEYDFQESTRAIMAMPSKVRYSNVIPGVAALLDMKDANHEIDDALWLTKSVDWAYEKEWRMKVSEGSKDNPAPPISAIIFGVRMSEENRRTLRNMAKPYHDVLFKEARMLSGHFRVTNETA